ncbi:unnamed protein product [Lupinus luteus]|uniref:Uncharacterized protein n=1 Tax=Lupinus luteus TaxID=3873 RepID=A0AAV1YLG2_LUPLU
MKEELTTLRFFVAAQIKSMEISLGNSELTTKVNFQSLVSVTLSVPQAMNVTLVEFEKHAGIQSNGKWKSNIWIHTEEEDRVPLWRTPLFKYYTHLANVPNWIDAANRKRTCHRDEFIRCCSCQKKRRFRLRTRQQIGQYHAALNNNVWKCSDWPYQKTMVDSSMLLWDLFQYVSEPVGDALELQVVKAAQLVIVEAASCAALRTVLAKNAEISCFLQNLRLYLLEYICYPIICVIHCVTGCDFLRKNTFKLRVYL